MTFKVGDKVITINSGRNGILLNTSGALVEFDDGAIGLVKTSNLRLIGCIDSIVVGEYYKHSDGTIVRVSSKEGDIIHTRAEICGINVLLSFLYDQFIEEFMKCDQSY